MVIYRKYRPKIFKEIIGQENVIRILENEIKMDKISHAYLFTGSRGLGKTTTARLMAKAINCLNRKKGQSEPCNKCIVCSSINKGQFGDLIELDAASQTGVDNVRENIISYSRIPPVIGKYKIFVIDEAHMLSKSAFNALLKTLEEPPSYVIFILATTEVYKIPDTIISRCQRFNFKKVPLEKIVNRLDKIAKAEKIKIHKNVLQSIAVRSEGCVRDAESLFNQVFAIGGKEITLKEASLVIPPSQTKSLIEFLEMIFKKEDSKAVALVNQLINDGIDLEQFVSDLISFSRKLILIKIKAVNDDLYWQQDQSDPQKAEKLAKSIDLKRLIEIIEGFIKTKSQFGYSPIPQLPIELAILKLCAK